MRYEVSIPRRIVVGAMPITVRLGAAVDEEVEALEFHGLYRGHRLTGDRQILIDSRQNPTNLSATFIHEALEAVSAVLTNQNIDHEIITTFGVGLHQIFEGMGLRFVKSDTVSKEAK